MWGFRIKDGLFSVNPYICWLLSLDSYCGSWNCSRRATVRLGIDTLIANILVLFGRPFVKRFALCSPLSVCLSALSCPVLSVTLVCCGQTVGRIKMKLGMQVVFSPDHTVLDGDPGPLPKEAQPPQFSAHVYCAQTAEWINASWCAGRPRPRLHCARWGPSSPPQKGGTGPKFSAHVYCAQMAEWLKMPLGMEVGLDPSNIVLDGDPAPLSKKRAEPPNFWPMSIVAKRLHESRCHLVRR